MVPGIMAPGKQVSVRWSKDGWDPSARECVCSVMLQEETTKQRRSRGEAKGGI